METIKKVIMWIIELFRRIFGKKRKISKKVKNSSSIEKLNKKKVNGSSNATLPEYMMISDQDKLVLINKMQNAKKNLNNNKAMKREIAAILALISAYGINNTKEIEEYLNKHSLDRINSNKFDALLNNCDIQIKKGVYSIINDYQDNRKIVKETVHNLDEVIGYVKNNDISYNAENLINDELSNIPIDNAEVEYKTVLFDRKILNTIKRWNKSIISEVEFEYQEINYVTISTVMLDKIIAKYQKIEDDYKNHRFNKSHYEKELGKIKEQIDYLKKIKNSKIVYNEIEKLRKELYTKSKDKYDILYNNEIFMNINKKCDELLVKVNQKVIDIKKEEKENKEDKRDKEREDYLKKILLRFQDLNLSRKLILLHKEEEKEISDYADIIMYLDMVYLDFISGVSENFNYQRNKTKTELVKLYNDLNNIRSYIRKEDKISVDHINFRMNDLVEAVIIRKNEVESIINNSKMVPTSDLVNEKIANIKKKFIEGTDEKVLKKTN